MQDRQPKYPGRVTVTLDAATAALLGVPTGTVLGGVLARNDEPFVEGHRLNKGTLFRDATANMLGLNPATAVPDDALQILAALAASGGSGSGDVGDLEDTSLEVGSFTNTGAGWNSFKFREAFTAPPHVVLQAEDFNGVLQVKTVTAEGFLYCARTLTDATTATAVVVHYIAIEYGGER